jgi:glycosyltransferase involved in cell wall biosynthesis
LYKLGKPFVWGPIGHHPSIEKKFIENYSPSFRRAEWLKHLLKVMFWRLSPALHKCIAKAEKIILMNSKALPHADKRSDKFALLSSVGTNAFLQDYSHEDASRKYAHGEPFVVLFIGRFVPLKGIDLVIKSFKAFADLVSISADARPVRLLLVGKGPYEDYMKQLMKENKLGGLVDIIQWLPHSELNNIYKKAHVFLFPSHEGAGMVVTEALANGLPVVCLDNCGPGEIVSSACGLVTDINLPYEEVVNDLAKSMFRLYEDREMAMNYSLAAYDLWKEKYSWDKKGMQLGAIYEEVQSKCQGN